MKKYLTNALCPVCKGILLTSDIRGYGFVCRSCGKYISEKHIMEPLSTLTEGMWEVSSKMSKEKYNKIAPYLEELLNTYKGDFLGYDCIAMNISWWTSGFPDDDTLNRFTRDLQAIEEMKC